jgi:chromosome segregation ATPase
MDRATFEWVHEVAGERDDAARALGQVTMERDALLDSLTQAEAKLHDAHEVIRGLRHDRERAKVRATRAEDRQRAADFALRRTRAREAELLEAVDQTRRGLERGLAEDRLLEAVRVAIDILAAHGSKRNGEAPALTAAIGRQA